MWNTKKLPEKMIAKVTGQNGGHENYFQFLKFLRYNYKKRNFLKSGNSYFEKFKL